MTFEFEDKVRFTAPFTWRNREWKTGDVGEIVYEYHVYKPPRLGVYSRKGSCTANDFVPLSEVELIIEKIIDESEHSSFEKKIDPNNPVYNSLVEETGFSPLPDEYIITARQWRRK